MERNVRLLIHHCPAVLFGESCVCTLPCIPPALKALCYKLTSRASRSFIPAFYKCSCPGSYERGAVNIISQVCCTLVYASPLLQKAVREEEEGGNFIWGLIAAAGTPLSEEYEEMAALSTL